MQGTFGIIMDIDLSRISSGLDSFLGRLADRLEGLALVLDFRERPHLG